MRKVLDVYWNLSEPDDHYLGKILAGMDPKQSYFEDLPPHWTLTNPIEKEDIARAMNLLFELILRNHEDCNYKPTALLLRYDECIVYHLDSLLS